MPTRLWRLAGIVPLENVMISLKPNSVDRPRWLPLPEDAWQPTIRSLHRWSQVVGKVRLALAPHQPHWWQIPLYVSARGLTTSAIPYDGGLVELEFLLTEHRFEVRTSSGGHEVLPLRPMSVAAFYADCMDALRRARVDVRIRPVPVEVVDATPFAQDVVPGGYIPEHAVALHHALIDAHRVLSRFQTGWVGKASPVHFFWGSFDLASTRFSGRRAPRHPGGAPNCPDWVMHEAYSHEVWSAGWWPGSRSVGAAFYTYMYPEPAGFAHGSLQDAQGSYDAELGEFVLPYAEVARPGDPDGVVLAFLKASYELGASLAGWDRAALDTVPATGYRAGPGSDDRGGQPKST
jgi:Family of unknown function (DUF5996)